MENSGIELDYAVMQRPQFFYFWFAQAISYSTSIKSVNIKLFTFTNIEY